MSNKDFDIDFDFDEAYGFDDDSDGSRKPMTITPIRKFSPAAVPAAALTRTEIWMTF